MLFNRVNGESKLVYEAYQMKKYLIIVMTLYFFIGCASEEERSNKLSVNPSDAFSFEDAAVVLPSPASVKLGANGRFDSRFQGNINYLRYQHDHYGEFMLEAFASRHYSPGELLERVWDGEYAGKWLDAATRTAVNTGDDTQLAMVDAFAASLCGHQQPDG